MRAMLARLRALPPLERAMLAEAVRALAVAALVIAILPFRRVAAMAGRPARRVLPPPADRAQLVRQVRWAIRASARRLPWRTKCFEQGLAAMWMLRRRGVAATLHYGVARASGADLAAHVWVRAGEVDVVGCEISGQFAELARFPPNE